MRALPKAALPVVLSISIWAVAQSAPPPVYNSSSSSINNDRNRVRGEEVTDKKLTPADMLNYAKAKENQPIPPEAKRLFREGVNAMGKQDWPTAVQNLKAAIEKAPRFVPAYNNLGVAYINSGDKQNAKAIFQKAVTISDANNTAFINLSRFLYEEKDLPGATKALAQGVHAHPADKNLLLRLATLQLEVGDLDGAIKSGRKMHEITGHEAEAEAHYICGSALQQKGDHKGALAEFNLVLKESADAALQAKARGALEMVQAASKSN